MKKVAVFTNNLRAGGAERIISYLLQEGADEFELHLILMQNEIMYDIPEEKIRIFELEGKQPSKIKSVLWTPVYAKKLRAYLEANNIETILSLLTRPNLIACKLRKDGWKGKVIISERADTLSYYNSLVFGKAMLYLVKKFYPYADEVTVISKGIARSLGKLGIKNCHVIYNPIPVLKEPLPKPANRPFTFINVARLYPQKNIPLLLNAFAAMKNKGARLIIVGKGPLLPELQALATGLHIEQRVSFEGHQPDVNSYLAKSDCFVFSSDFEGFGNVIIEALNTGTPVISTDCPHGPREILAPDSNPEIARSKEIELEKYGILVPVKRPDLLAKAMDKIYEDKELWQAYASLSRERVVDFDIKKIAKKYFGLF